MVTSAFMVLTGFGLGLVMQVLILAVQNGVDYKDLGTATSLAAFFRSMGGAFGTALLGAVLNDRLIGNLTKALPAAARSHVPEIARQIVGSPAQLKLLPRRFTQRRPSLTCIRSTRSSSSRLQWSRSPSYCHSPCRRSAFARPCTPMPGPPGQAMPLPPVRSSPLRRSFSEVRRL